MKRRLVLFATGLLGTLLHGFPALAVPLIHEVFYDAEGVDAAHVFTEISGLPGTRLDGYRLVGIDGGSGLVYRQFDLTGASIPEDGLLVIATARASGELLAVRDFVADVDWQNGPEAVQLWDSLGAVVDALQYGDAGPRRLGEGRFAPDPPMGLSLTRDLLSSDTGDNQTDFLVSTPTPGTGRALSSVPEPAASLVLVLGLLGIRARHRHGLKERALGQFPP
ncbi:MAG TPA: hypothetical protein VIE88_08015 [Vicinamibacteria bacterium]